MLGGGGLLLADGCKDDALGRGLMGGILVRLWSNLQQNRSKHFQDPANLTPGNLTLLMPVQRLSFKEHHSSNFLKVIKLELYGQVYSPSTDFTL